MREAAVMLGLASWELEAVADINGLESEAFESEAKASDVRWQQAEKVAAALDAGMSQQKLADSWRRPDGTTYSRPHVSYVRAAWQKFGNLSYEERPSWNEAYNSPEVRGTAAQRIVASTENEWYTPSVYVDAARKVLGAIDLDPASSAEANKTVRATTFYDAARDGLQEVWRGRVWLNPPYGRLAGDFVARLDAAYLDGAVTAGIALVNAHCTDTEWFKPCWNQLLCFTDHRIDFEAAGREKATTSTHGSVFVYFGEKKQRFADSFKRFGTVVLRWGNRSW